MTLQEEIEQTRQEIWIDSYSLSIGEWISLYQKQEIALKLEQTKTFYWTNPLPAKNQLLSNRFF